MWIGTHMVDALQLPLESCCFNDFNHILLGILNLDSWSFHFMATNSPACSQEILAELVYAMIVSSFDSSPLHWTFYIFVTVCGPGTNGWDCIKQWRTPFFLWCVCAPGIKGFYGRSWWMRSSTGCGSFTILVY